MKNGFFYIAFLCMASVFFGCNEQEKTGSLGETELYFNERLSSISAMVTLLSGSEAKLVIYGT